MMSAKLATPDLLKTKIFQIKGYYWLWRHNKISSRDSKYISDMIERLKFGNSSISMREVIVTSIL